MCDAVRIWTLLFYTTTVDVQGAPERTDYVMRSEFGDGGHLVLMLTCGACGDFKCLFCRGASYGRRRSLADEEANTCKRHYMIIFRFSGLDIVRLVLEQEETFKRYYM